MDIFAGIRVIDVTQFISGSRRTQNKLNPSSCEEG